MIKIKILIFVLLFLFNLSLKAQYRSKLAIKVGLNYVFTGKNTELKSGFDFKAAFTLRTSDYVYVGPQFSFSKFFGADRVKYKNPSYMELAPLVALDLIGFANDKVFKPTNLNTQDKAMVFEFALGFNLDKNTKSRERFSVTKFNMDVSVSSNRILNEQLFLNGGLDLFFNRAQIRNAISLGLGAAIGLQK